MTTLITQGNSEGTRRCDATCHDAKGSVCKCCCGGRNHGVGLIKARENTEAIAKEFLARAGKELVVTKGRIEIRELEQRTRFHEYRRSDLTRLLPEPDTDVSASVTVLPAGQENGQPTLDGLQ